MDSSTLPRFIIQQWMCNDYSTLAVDQLIIHKVKAFLSDKSALIHIGKLGVCRPMFKCRGAFVCVSIQKLFRGTKIEKNYFCSGEQFFIERRVW